MADHDRMLPQAMATRQAFDRIEGAINDLAAEHEVTTGPFDPSKWSVEVKVADLQALVAAVPAAEATPSERREREADSLRSEDALEAAKKLLIGASIGSCTCNTKSPDLMWHEPNCRYVKIMMALENVELAAASRSPAGSVDATDPKEVIKAQNATILQQANRIQELDRQLEAKRDAIEETRARLDEIADLAAQLQAPLDDDHDVRVRMGNIAHAASLALPSTSKTSGEA